MTPGEAALKTVEIWNEVAKLINTTVSKATPQEIRISIFERAHALYISGQIQADRKEAAAAKEQKPKSDVNCKYCNRVLTVAEKKYCDDHDQQYVCYQCSKK